MKQIKHKKFLRTLTQPQFRNQQFSPIKTVFPNIYILYVRISFEVDWIGSNFKSPGRHTSSQ